MADTGFHILTHRRNRAKREAQREAEAEAKAEEQRERADAAGTETNDTRDGDTTGDAHGMGKTGDANGILGASVASSAEAGNQPQPTKGRHGGPRPNSGRKPGSLSKLGKRSQRALNSSPTLIAAREFVAFKGDGLEFLRWCYQNTTLPVAFRAECAAKAAAYERPKLMTTALTGKDGGPILLEQIATAAMEKRDKLREQQQTPAPEADASTVH